MSANSDNEETVRQLESRLQQLESQRTWEEYEREEKKRKARTSGAYAVIASAILLTFIWLVFTAIYQHVDVFLGIWTLVVWITGFAALSHAHAHE